MIQPLVFVYLSQQCGKRCLLLHNNLLAVDDVNTLLGCCLSWETATLEVVNSLNFSVVVVDAVDTCNEVAVEQDFELIQTIVADDVCTESINCSCWLQLEELSVSRKCIVVLCQSLLA